MIPPAASTFKERLQAGAPQRPDGSDVKLPIPFQIETVFLEKSALVECAYPFLGLISLNITSQTPNLVCNYMAVVHL